MTRLASSARDYAIALLAPSDLCALDALESVERLDGLACWASVNGALARVDDACPDSSLRILRARVALYLRLLRRVEAWERGEEWAGARGTVLGPWDRAGRRPVAWWPWRPLWTAAPPHEPGATARMRRGR